MNSTSRVRNSATPEPGPFSDDISRLAGPFHGVYSPLPVDGKKPLVKGYTGWDGKWPDKAKRAEWTRKYPWANIAARLRSDFIGLDIDAYGAKKGAATLREWEAEYGPLPVTLMTTSRPGRRSGIRWFRVPPLYRGEGQSWRGELGPGAEVVTWYHRHIVLPPSVHPEGRAYRWMRTDGTELHPAEVADALPELIADLPADWADALSADSERTRRAAGPEYPTGGARTWLERFGAGEPCDWAAGLAEAGSLALRSAGPDGGAYEAAKGLTWNLVLGLAEGHRGVLSTLPPLRRAYLAAVAPRRGGRDAAEEWRRLVLGAAREAEARTRGAAREPDPCLELEGFAPIRVRRGDL